MLEAKLKDNTTKRVSIESIYGDMRPALSSAKTLPNVRRANDPLAAFRLNDLATFNRKNYRKDIFESLLARDYAKLDQKPDNPVVLNRIGMTYLQSGKLDKAVRFFRKAHKSNPQFLSAAQNLAHALILTGKLEDATKVYAELVVLSANNSAMLHELAFVKMLQGKSAEARKLLEKISSDFPQYFEVQNTLGLISLSLKEKEKAKKYFEKSKALNPLYAHAWNNIGAVLKEDGELQKAKKYFEKATELDQNYLVAHFNLFNVEASDKDYETALRHISSLQHLVALNPDVLFKKAWILMSMGRFKEALSEYDKFLEVLPRNWAALNNIGHCYVSLGRRDLAISYFTKAHEAAKGEYMPVHNLMIVLTDASKYSQAKEIAEQVLANGEVKDDAVHYAMAGYWLDKEDWDKAEIELQKAIKLKTSIESVYANQGFILTDIRKDYKGAINLLRARYKAGIREFSIINNLAHAYLRSGDVSKAKEYVDLIDVPHPVGMATRALYELKTGHLKKAREIYEAAVEITIPQRKEEIEQQYHFDLGLYFLGIRDYALANEELVRAAEYKKAKDYIRDEIVEALASLKGK